MYVHIMQVWTNWRQGRSASLIDTTLGLMRTDSTAEKMKRCIHTGLLCVQNSEEDRPSIGSVIYMLPDNSVPLPTPSQPAFVTSPVQQLNWVSSFFAFIRALAGVFADCVRLTFMRRNPQTDIELASSLAVEC